MLKTLITFVLLCSVAYSVFQPPTSFASTMRDLYWNEPSDMTMMALEWDIEGLISKNVRVGYCGSSPVLGGPGVIGSQGSFSRTYTLYSHTIIYFDIGVKMIGNWKENNNVLTMTVDGAFFKSFTILKVGSSDKSSSCSNTGNDLDTRLVGQFYHTANSVTISLSWDLSSPELSFAIADVSLTHRYSAQAISSNAFLTLTDTLVKTNSLQPSDNGKTNCPTGSYSDGLYCMKCNSVCEDCFGPSSSQCYQCKMGYSFYGAQCLRCAPDCAICSGPETHQCLLCNPDRLLDFDGSCVNTRKCNTSPAVIKSNKDLGYSDNLIKICQSACPSGDFLFWNYTCISSCAPPLVQVRMPGSPVLCTNPCSPYQFLLEDGRCLNECPDGYSTRQEGLYGFCDLLNATNSTAGCESIFEFKYENGSCLPSCPYPHIDEWHNGGYFCYPPCSLGYWDVLSGSCIDNCEPEFIRFDDDILYCDSKSDNSTNSTTGCPNYWEFKYPNGSCLPSCPYPRRNEWNNGSYFCYPPCPLGYFDALNQVCVGTCEAESIRFEDDILFCDGQDNNGTNSTNSTTGCPSIWDFKYPNGSCLSSCPYPRRDEWHDGSYFCYPPCPLGYFDSLNQVCIRHCEAEYIRFQDDILFCDGHSDHNNGTNSTNSTTGCPSIWDFKYPNGSCLSSCPYPRRDEWHNGSYFCYPPCPGRYYDSIREICISSCEPEEIRFDDDIIYCDDQSSHNNGTNNTNSTTGCSNYWEFKYLNGSCLPSCPYPHRDEWHNGSYFCFPPCSHGYWSTLNEICVGSCEPESIRFDDDILYCDGQKNGTNSTNSTTGCPNYWEFKYPNGSCLSSCPYPRRDEWHDGSYFCYPPCRLGYFDTLNEVCVRHCEPEYLRIEDDILYCDGKSDSNNGTNNTNSTIGCPNIFDFKYPNGSCLSSCPYPRRDEWHNGSYFCYPPCPGRYYDILRDVCVNSCEPEEISFDDDIIYCDGQSNHNNGTNNTNSTTGCPNYWEFKYPNGSCLSSCPYPRRDEWHNGSYFCYPPCPLGYFDIEKEACVNSCEPEYIEFDHDILYCTGQSNSTNPNNGTNSTNSTAGCPSIFDFKYPNGSCLPSCPYPRRDEWHDGAYFCYPPCPLGYFDILNQVCIRHCEAEYIRFQDDILFCDGHSDHNNGTNSTNSTTGCPSIFDFKYPNGSCLPSCPYPRRDEWHNGSYFCYPPCPGRYYDSIREICVNSCEPEEIRFDDDIIYCDDQKNNGTNGTNSTTGCPNYWEFKYPNGSCLSSCPYPHRDEWHNGSYFCYPPCPNRYFDVVKEACIDSCEPEFIEFGQDILYCIGQSNSTNPNNGTNSTNSTTGCPNIFDFKYPNGSCLSSCPYPRRDEWHNGSYFCYPPCPLGYFDSEKDSCINSCEPEYVRFDDDILYCDGHTDPNNGSNSTNSTMGCPNIFDFKYPNGSCLPNCSYPRRDEWYNGTYFCYPPCPLGYFDTEKDTCVNSCQPEFVRFDDDILYCDGQNNNGTNSTNSTAGCPSIYDFKYPNGSCLSSCPYPRRDEWHNGSYFCYPPCPLGFFDVLKDSCVNSCQPEYVRIEDDIVYCDGYSDHNNGTNSTNSTTGCPNVFDYKYPNGSCLPNCSYPRRDEWHNGSYFCYPPCPLGYFDIEKDSCTDSCEPEFVRFEDDILYCDGHSDHNNGTNNTNSTTGCPNIYDFKYPNGSCLSSCPDPRRDEWHNGSYFCYPPCPNGYWSPLGETCVGSCEPEFIEFVDDILYCIGQSGSNNGTNGTNSTTGCPSIYDFKYPNGSCLPSCPYPYRDEWHDGSYFCYPPCPNRYFDLVKEACVDSCEPEYIQFEEDILYCTGQSNSTNGTNSTNSTSGCPNIYDFKYPNGSCLSSCPLPRQAEWHNGSYFCYPPCPPGWFDTIDVCVDECKPEYVRFVDDYLYCDDPNNGTNNNNSTTGCPSIWDYRYPNGSCLPNCPYPRTHEWYKGILFCDPPCNGYFDILNDKCVDSCEPEFVQFDDDILYCTGQSNSTNPNNGTNSTNSTTGCPNIFDFKYPNGSCLPSCPYPRRDEWHDGSYFCYSPCPLGYFDTLNQVCVRTCEAEFIRFEEDILYCDGRNNGTNSTNSTTGCPNYWEFKYPNGSCLSSCPYPHRDEWHNGSYFCYPLCPGRYYDNVRETCINSCEPEYIRFDDDILYCDGNPDPNNGTNSTNSTTGCPSVWDFKYLNGSCLPSCPYPYRDEWSNGSYFCYSPCSQGYFDILSESCVNDCEPEYIRFEDDILYCEGHSNHSNGTNSTNSTTGCPSVWDFKYPNGSCLPSCPYPHINDWHDGGYFCYPPCPNKYFDNAKGTCVDSCEPEYVRFDNDILYCEGHSNGNNGTNNTNSTTGCPSLWDFKYPDGSCLPSCPYPHRDEWHDGSYFCYPPCPGRYFGILKDACVDSCEPEFVVFEEGILYCIGQSEPANPNNGTNSTNSTTGCPSIDEFKYPNGSCLSRCPYPHRLEWRNNRAFCSNPCPGRYYGFLNDGCVDSCEPEFVRFEDDIVYCAGPHRNSTNSTSTPCPSIWDWKYPNGSCLSFCHRPHKEEWHFNHYFCSPPCPNSYFDVMTEMCINSCEPEYMRFDDDILYCDGKSDPNNGTNSTTGCPNYWDFKYPNGSCLSSCPYPHRDEWHDGSYFCNPPCPGRYYDNVRETCLNSCEPEDINFEDDILYCETDSNSTSPNNGTNSTTVCPWKYDFRYFNGSCLSSCPAPFNATLTSEGYFCDAICPSGYYFHTLEKLCVGTCQPDYIWFNNYYLYCDDQSTSNNCSAGSGYKYTNDSCLSSCNYPYRDELYEGVNLCHPPCQNRYFDAVNLVCLDTCESRNIRIVYDIHYCDPESPSSNGTNSTNSTTGCPNIYDFKYENGSCLSTCPYPYKEELSSGYSFCNVPCPDGYFDTSSEACIDSCEPEYIRFEDGIAFCGPSSNSSECTIDYAVDGSATTDCTDPSGYCPTGSFIFEDYSCNVTCPAEFTPSLNASCTFPCGLDGALYPDGSCSSDCSTGYTAKMIGNFQLCVKNTTTTTPPTNNNQTNSTNSTTGGGSSYTVTVQIYIRYNITLSDFNSLGYLIKFRNLLANLLGVDSSQIIIISIILSLHHEFFKILAKITPIYLSSSASNITQHKNQDYY